MKMTSQWTEQAACVGLPTEWFFPERGGAAAVGQAKAICHGCPVVGECLAFAFATATEDGIWGGLTPAERAA